MKYSQFIAICFLASVALVLSSCSVKKNEYAAEHGISIRQLEQLTFSSPQISNPAINSYLEQIVQRLTGSIPNGSRSPFKYEVLLLDSAKPLAVATGAGKLVVSRGLVLRVHNEAELAFVLAHEMAHQELGHISILHGDTEPGSDLRRKLEQEADLHGVGILAMAGYDPRVSYGALGRIYRYLDPSASQASHPTFQSRVDTIRTAIVNSGWTPPGTIDRRGFRVVRHALMRLTE